MALGTGSLVHTCRNRKDTGLEAKSTSRDFCQKEQEGAREQYLRERYQQVVDTCNVPRSASE